MAARLGQVLYWAACGLALLTFGFVAYLILIVGVPHELIEQIASDAYDAGASVDEAGCTLVTSEALDRVGRSA